MVGKQNLYRVDAGGLSSTSTKRQGNRSRMQQIPARLCGHDTHTHTHKHTTGRKERKIKGGWKTKSKEKKQERRKDRRKNTTQQKHTATPHNDAQETRHNRRIHTNAHWHTKGRKEGTLSPLTQLPRWRGCADRAHVHHPTEQRMTTALPLLRT